MHEIAPALTEAVATRITSTELHDGALRDLGAFVHRTLVEDEHAYAVRIDDGALLDAAEQIARARAQLTAADRRQLAGILDCPADKLDARARRARRPRQDDGVQAARRRRAARARPHRPLRLRARARRRLRRRHLGHRPRVHARRDPRAARSQRRHGRARAELLRRRPPATTPSCARPASRTARSAPTRAPARSRRRARTSGSATTCAPA